MRVSDEHLDWLLNHVQDLGGDFHPIMKDLRDARKALRAARTVLVYVAEKKWMAVPVLDEIDRILYGKGGSDASE